MFIVGIDIGKRNHEATIIDQGGSIIGKAFRFANSITGFNRLKEIVKRVTGYDVVFGMEATGHYWLALYTHLRKEGFVIHVINAIQSDALRAMYIRQQKNDSRDSFIIADVIRFGRFCETTVSPPDLFALRELCRHRFYTVDSVSDIKRKVIALLDQIFPEYENLFTDTFGKASLELLSEYTTPEEILNVDTDKLVETINIASHGRLGLKKASEIQDAARNSFGILLATDTIALLIRQYIEQIRFVEKQIDLLDAEIARLLSAFETQLTTITGVGPTLAAVILSEIGDVKRFNSAAKLAAFAGVDPTMKQSGDFTGSRNRMSKRGSPYLRRALWLAATVASFKDPAISAFYQRKRAEGKSHLTTLGHVARKMVNIIFAVLRDNSPYSPTIAI
ncbi:MAG: IS110 family transposase [Synergistaceae bacterium]|nr:IS110 family transposase [Synergistaceae bacterium]